MSRLDLLLIAEAFRLPLRAFELSAEAEAAFEHHVALACRGVDLLADAETFLLEHLFRTRGTGRAVLPELPDLLDIVETTPPTMVARPRRSGSRRTIACPQTIRFALRSAAGLEVAGALVLDRCPAPGASASRLDILGPLIPDGEAATERLVLKPEFDLSADTGPGTFALLVATGAAAFRLEPPPLADPHERDDAYERRFRAWNVAMLERLSQCWSG